MKMKMLKGAVIGTGRHAEVNEIIEVEDDIAHELLIARAAEIAPEDAEVGKPKTVKK